jgi:hypothetical protein
MSLDEELYVNIHLISQMIGEVRRSIEMTLGRREFDTDNASPILRLIVSLEEAQRLLRQPRLSRVRNRLAHLKFRSEKIDVSVGTLQQVAQLLSEAVDESIYQKISALPIVSLIRRPQIWPPGYLNTADPRSPKEPSGRDGEILLVGNAISLILEKIEETQRIMGVMRLATALIDSSPAESEENSDLVNIARLKSILPTQKIAPLQFEIVHDKIKILSRSSKAEEFKAEEFSVSPVLAAKTEILELGDQIVLELERSNCDRRLLDAISKTQGQIISEENIVRIAISGMYCGNLAKEFQAELAGAVDVMLSTYSITIGMYAAQFPEWRGFLENSASAQIDESDLSDIQSTMLSLADNLESNLNHVDPEVPRTLREIGQFIQHPRQSAKRMAFAAVRTAENLVISIWKHSADFLMKTLDKTKETGSSIASKAVLYSLIGIALSAAAGISPLTSKIPEMGWMRNAIELVERQRTRLMQD